MQNRNFGLFSYNPPTFTPYTPPTQNPIINNLEYLRQTQEIQRQIDTSRFLNDPQAVNQTQQIMQDHMRRGNR